MAKLKPIAFTVGIMLLIGAALCLYFSLRNLSSIRPASAYEDMGVHIFVPEEVYPVQRENAYEDMGVHIFVPEEVYPVQRENHATGRQKRNYPTTTVYIVRYRAEDGSGYQYKYESGSVESTAQNILETGEPIERRVLSIPDEDGYITIGANETAQTYEARQKRTYWTIAGVSAAYLLVWLAVNGLLLYKRRKAGETE